MPRRNPAIIALLAAGPLLAAAPLASAQTTPPGSTATRPAKDPPAQTSIPSMAPPATTSQTTGATNQDPVVKKMNEEEKAKVESKGK
jgi:hypothetical protein